MANRASRRNAGNKASKEILRKKRARKLKMLLFSFVLLFSGLSARTFYLKAEYGDEYERKAIEQQVKKNSVDQYINPNRGTILDRNRSLQALAISTTVYNVVWDIRLMVKEDKEVQEQAVEILHSVLEIPRDTLYEYIAINPDTKAPYYDTHYQVIAKKIDTKTKNILEEENPKYVWYEEDTYRRYPNGTAAASLIGFVSGGSNWGLEAVYDNELTGVQGRILRLYDLENNVVTEKVNPTQGHTVITTIDLLMQQTAQGLVEKYGREAESESAALIVYNPNTGEVLAMAEYPTFDLNNPTNIDYINKDSLQLELSLLDEEEKINRLYSIWRNYCVYDSYEPGSIYKPLVVAAALEEGVISPNETFYCGGRVDIYGTSIPCWNRNGHGHLTLEEVLAQSCNMGMIEIAERLGRERYYNYQKDFGIGDVTGIDLFGENPDTEYLVHGLEALNPVELAAASMGQGFNVTSIQAVNGFAAVINGGNLMKPYVVSQIIDSDNNIVQEFGPQIQRKVVSKEVSDWVRERLKNTVSLDGTGKKAVIEGYSIGGKTGTGQQGVKGPNTEDELVQTFMAYFPVDDPEYLVLAVIDRPVDTSDGNSQAVPMAREMIQSIIQQNHIPPDMETDATDNLLYDDIIIIDDYIGMNIADVSKAIHAKKVDFEVAGNGAMVIGQMPAGGAQVTKGSKIFLTLSEIEGGQEELGLVPNATDMSRQQAEEAIVNAGFVPVFVDNTEQSQNGSASQEQDTAGEEDDGDGEISTGTVVSQSPRYEIKLQRGTEIKLYLE